MEELYSIRKDAELLTYETAEARHHLLDNILTRFRRVEKAVASDIDDKFRKLADKHHGDCRRSYQPAVLPPISRQQAPPQPQDRIDPGLQRKILAQLVLPKDQPEQQLVKPLQKKKRKVKHLYTHTQPLTSLQRFYNFADVEVPTSQYASSGIYNLVNIYKADNVDLTYLEEAQPKAVRNKLSNRDFESKLSNINFLTKTTGFRQTIKLLGEQNEDTFITRTAEEGRTASIKVQAQTLPEASVVVQQQTASVELPPHEKIIVFEELTFLTIRKYQLVEDREYHVFRLEHLPSWGRILATVRAIVGFLRKYCIKEATIKGNVLLETDNANSRLSEESILCCFVNRAIYEKLRKDHRKIQFQKNKELAARAIQQCWRAIMIMKRHRRIQRSKKEVMLRCLCQWRHYKFRQQLKLRYNQKLEWCVSAQQRLDREWSRYESAVEVHIPSFSLDEWNRLTTHHMTSFESQISRLWRAEARTVIMVMPAVDSGLLNEYLKLLSLQPTEIHVVVPENSTFPGYLSLASKLYYSDSALRKIRSIIAGRKAYIVPGRMSSCKEEVLLSHSLELPLYCPNLSLLGSWSLQQTKRLLVKAGLPTLPYFQIEPESTVDMLAAQLLVMLVSHPKVPVWLLKMNSESMGRGIAQVCLYQDKQIQRLAAEVSLDDANCGRVCDDLHRLIVKFLECRLRCCQQLYRRDEYIQKLLKKGGIVEAQQEVDNVKLRTYEVSLEVTPSEVRLLGVLRCIKMLAYCDKTFVKDDNCQLNVQSLLDKLKSQLSSRGFRGFCSLTVILEEQSHRSQGSFLQSSIISQSVDEQPSSFYAVDVKPYLTSAGSSLFLMSNPSCKYLFVEQVSHANIKAASPFELLTSIRKSREKEQGCVLLAMNNSYSLLVGDSELVNVRRTAVEVLRGIQYRGSACASGQKEFVRSDCYSLSEIATAIKTAL